MLLDYCILINQLNFGAGVGVGGEYPMASSSAAERAEGSKETRKRRGRAVVLTFSQQVRTCCVCAA